MDKSKYNIHIIGAGVSGLIAARVLEQHGYVPTILEGSGGIGGRVKTTTYQGMPLDHGFQVILTAYPMVQKYLDIAALEPCYFDSGAAIYSKGDFHRIGDPLRNPYLLFPTIISKVATLKDKVKIFLLQRGLQKKTITEIFDGPETSTLQYLRKKGFSERVIHTFFLPFFSGIFLEDQLSTSSRMFEFVYKMFGEGKAMLPKQGIQAVPQQLSNSLTQTKIQFNTKVAEVTDDQIIMDDGTALKSDFTIIATEASGLVRNLRKQEVPWKRCETFYFNVTPQGKDTKLIHLSADKNAWINSVVFLSRQLDKTDAGEIISVTVVKPYTFSMDQLVKNVMDELQQLFSFDTIELIKQFTITKALPDLNNLKGDLSPQETRLLTRVFLCGDTLLNGSLNAAMLSGERAAQGVIEVLEESPDLAQFTTEYLN